MCRRRSRCAVSAAHAAVRLAVQEGRLPAPERCESCGIEGRDVPAPRGRSSRRLPPIVYHHWRGYEGDAATDVEALCRRCHGLIHAGKRPEPRTGRLRDDPAVRRGPWYGAAAYDAVLDHMLKGGRLPPFMSRQRYAEVARDVTKADLDARREQHAKWAAWRLARVEQPKAVLVALNHPTGGEPVTVINNPRKQRPAHRRSA